MLTSVNNEWVAVLGAEAKEWRLTASPFHPPEFLPSVISVQEVLALISSLRKDTSCSKL